MTVNYGSLEASEGPFLSAVRKKHMLEAPFESPASSGASRKPAASTTPKHKFLFFLGLMLLLSIGVHAQRPGERQRRVTPPRDQPSPPSQPVSPGDQLERIRQVESQDERIELLKKFLI